MIRGFGRIEIDGVDLSALVTSMTLGLPEEASSLTGYRDFTEPLAGFLWRRYTWKARRYEESA